jgi:NADPH-ferrihemoprotein reductase
MTSGMTNAEVIKAVAPVGLALICCYGAYTLIFKSTSDKDKFIQNQKSLQSNLQKTKTKKPVNKRNFVERMNDSDRTMVIYYGSQTGTAEEFAFRISQNARRYGIKSLVLNPEDVDFEELENMKSELDLSKNITLIMCMATYGEGDPTDNASELYDWFVKENREEDMLTGINFAVFGLGNRTYEQFCSAGIKFDKKLEKYGATRLVEVGLGDDNGNIEEDFVKWEENLWNTIISKYDIDISKISSDTQNIYKLIENKPDSRFYTGEPYRLDSYKKQRKPFLPSKNPYLSKVLVNRTSLDSSKIINATRNYMHIDFDLTDSGVRYEAGDHLAVLVPNSDDLVNKILNLLNINQEEADKIISLTAVDEDAPKQHPFPCPTTWRVAFKHYLDLRD